MRMDLTIYSQDDIDRQDIEVKRVELELMEVAP